ncbi:hypothetical protein [Algoriphagus namhaensis]
MRALYFFLVLLLVSSCDSDQERVSESEVDPANLEKDALNLSLEKGLNQAKEWVNAWPDELNLQKEDFALMRTDSLRDVTMPERNPILQDDPLYDFQYPHPSGDGRIDIYSAKVEARKDTDEAFFNPDSKVVWYRADGMKETLLFMGPAGMLDEGMWLNDTQFVVLGSLQSENGFQPMFWLIDMEKDLLYQFEHSGLTSDYDPVAYLEAKLKNLELR